MAKTTTRPAGQGSNAHIFKPPNTPTASPPRATTTATPGKTDLSAERKRKRTRPESSQEQEVGTPGWQRQCPTPSDAMFSSAQVNERYALKWGYDTPGLMASEERQQRQLGSEGGDRETRRRGGRDGHGSIGTGSGARTFSGPLARERNGTARLPSSPNGPEQSSAGWTSFAFNLVGKVFNFGTTVFKGFYAGGGTGYNIPQHHQESPTDDAGIQRRRRRSGGTPIPGSWKDDEDFLGDFEQDNPSNTTSPSTLHVPSHSNKRRQTDRDSWVLVGTPDVTDPSPKRKPSSTSVYHAHTIAARPSPSRNRRSLAPISRRASSYISHSGSPANHSPRRTSHAPTRLSPRPSMPNLHHPSPEAERYAKRQARQDKSMNHMNRQLKDLIQQAQTALGTKYEVDGGEDVVMDEGFVDDEEDW